MAGIKILSPMVEEYIIVVSIPQKTPVTVVKGQSIREAEEYFIARRENAESHSRKIELDQARALLKWASCCNADLEGMSNAGRKVKFYFSFSSAEDMLAFRDSMSTNVSGATMK